MYLGSTAKSTFGWKTLFSWKDVCARPRTLSENQPRKVSYYWAKRATFVFYRFCFCVSVRDYAHCLGWFYRARICLLRIMLARLYKTPKKTSLRWQSEMRLYEWFSNRVRGLPADESLARCFLSKSMVDIGPCCFTFQVWRLGKTFSI